VRTPVTLLVNPLPTVVTTTIPHLCAGSSSTSVTYSSTNSPTTYSLAWDAAAHTAGFTDVVDAPLPVGNIPITLPPAAPAGTYNGTLTVKNANSCVSSVQPVSVTIDAQPTQPTINITP